MFLSKLDDGVIGYPGPLIRDFLFQKYFILVYFSREFYIYQLYIFIILAFDKKYQIEKKNNSHF